MKTTFLEKLRCPRCKSNLFITEGKTSDDWLEQGALGCQNGHQFTVDDGIPHLYLEDDSWLSKAREAQGWIDYHKDHQMYEITAEAIDFQIPYYPEEPWLSFGKSFDRGVELLGLTGSEVVLDLGAGRGWAAKQFALRGCDVVATDIVADLNIGLGRAYAIMGEAEVAFALALADGENLPFAEHTFDIVFCSAVLHHASNLPKLIQSIAKVLKPGGRLCAVNEPCIPIWESEKAILARDAVEELDYGINETRPNFIGYYQAITDAGLEVIQLAPTITYQYSAEEIKRLSEHLGVTLRWGVGIRPMLWSLYSVGTKRWRSWVNGTLTQAQSYQSADLKTNRNFDILKWFGGEMLLLAQKPPIS